MGLIDATTDGGGDYRTWAQSLNQTENMETADKITQGALAALQDEAFEWGTTCSASSTDNFCSSSTVPAEEPVSAQGGDPPPRTSAPGDNQPVAQERQGTSGGTGTTVGETPPETGDQQLRERLEALRRQLGGGATPPPEATRPPVQVETPPVSETPLRTGAQLRDENRRIGLRVGELEQQLVRDRFDPERRDAIVQELQGIMRRLEILQLNLPDNATNADIRRAQDTQVRREAARLGVPTDIPIGQIYMRVGQEREVRALRDQFARDCQRFSLDPARSNYGDLRFRLACEQHRLNPTTTTREAARAAREADNRRYWAGEFGLNPATATQADVDRARDRHIFQMDCLHERLDPRSTTPARLAELHEQRQRESHASWCRSYDLNPATTTRTQLDEVHNFNVDCHLYNLDARTTTRQQLATRRHEADCRSYGLNPQTATANDVERARELETHQRLCRRYQLDSRAATPADLHEIRCETFGVPLSTTRDRLLELEDRWDTRRY